MANTPIIDIDVNSEKFKAFYDLFQEYHAKLEAMPDDWKKVDAATKKAAMAFGAISGAAAGSFDEAVKKAHMLTSEVNRSTHAQKQFHQTARSSASELKKMASFAGATAKHIFGIGKYLFKIGALGSGIGLLGGFGLRELGEGAVNTQRSARGLGMTPGQIKAWHADMGRYIGPGILSSVANQQNSYQGRVWLGMSTGLNPMQVANMRPDQVSERLMLKAHDWWKNTPPAMRTTENMQARGFMQSGLTLEDMRRLGNTSRATLENSQRQYAKDAKAFNLSDPTVTAWYKFTRELSVAGNAIETVLTKRLAALAPVLGGFVNSLTKDAENLINGVLSPANVDKAAAGIKEFAEYLGSPDFRKKVSDFASAIGTLASVTVRVAKWLGDVMPSSKTIVHRPAHELPDSTLRSKLPNHIVKPKTFDQKLHAVWKSLPGYSNGIIVRHPSGAQLPNNAQLPNKAYKPDWVVDQKKRTAKTGSLEQNNALNPNWAAIQKKRMAKIGSLEQKYKLPKGMLKGVYSAESNNGLNPGLSSAGAKGPFQFMPKTAKAYGITNRSSFSQESVGAARKMADLMREYHGDARKAAAAYNWGDGNLNNDISSHGAKWYAYAPKQTQNYVGKIVSHIVLENKTGSSVAKSANALGY